MIHQEEIVITILTLIVMAIALYFTSDLSTQLKQNNKAKVKQDTISIGLCILCFLLIGISLFFLQLKGDKRYARYIKNCARKVKTK